MLNNPLLMILSAAHACALGDGQETVRDRVFHDTGKGAALPGQALTAPRGSGYGSSNGGVLQLEEAREKYQVPSSSPALVSVSHDETGGS